MAGLKVISIESWMKFLEFSQFLGKLKVVEHHAVKGLVKSALFR